VELTKTRGKVILVLHALKDIIASFLQVLPLLFARRVSIVQQDQLKELIARLALFRDYQGSQNQRIVKNV
jgi:hypothetical protein